MRCFLGHRWMPVDVTHDGDYIPPVTHVLDRCKRCDATRVRKLPGTWRLDDLTPRADQ